MRFVRARIYLPESQLVRAFTRHRFVNARPIILRHSAALHFRPLSESHPSLQTRLAHLIAATNLFYCWPFARARNDTDRITRARNSEAFSLDPRASNWKIIAERERERELNGTKDTWREIACRWKENNLYEFTVLSKKF